MTQASNSQDPSPPGLIHRDHHRPQPVELAAAAADRAAADHGHLQPGQPALLGFPFFFWFQLLFTLLAAAVSGIVFVMTRRRS